jgi:hypothetical protein
MPPITHYTIVHRVKGTSTINLRLNDGTSASLTGLSVAEAGYIVDVLRNEKPTNWIPGQQLLSSGELEPVGEGERSGGVTVISAVASRARTRARRR